MMTEISGFCEARFRPLETAFRANFADGLELGASLGVTHRGRTVVDLWGGWADIEQTQPWRDDTVVIVTSTTKILLITAVLMLVDRGLIELDAPVARYWPQFAQGGKAGVTLRDALTHQGGVPGWDPPVAFEALEDWEAITERVAAEPHWFDGQRRVVYHAFTYGFLLGEVIRRVDGRRPARFVAEEITGKAGADFQIGLQSKSDLSRLAQVRPPEQAPPEPPPGSVLARLRQSVMPGDPTRWERLSADIPASNGYANGRSIARVCAILAMGGELDGQRFLSRQLIEEAAREQVFGDCPYLGPLRLGLGFGLHSSFWPAPSPTCFHWGGYGGSWGLMDMSTGVSLGYAPNNFLVDLEDVSPRLKRFSDTLAALLPDL